jgi:hypothetical protein
MYDQSSPYLKSSSRLADVLAAIQVMGSYPWATRDEAGWQDKLGAPLSANAWIEIFREHPEFFRVNEESRITLRWRHGYDKSYHVANQRELTPSELNALSQEERKQVTRKPLTEDQIETLLKTAIELHTRAVAFAQERRWLSPLLFGLLGTILGIVLQAALK